MKHKIDKDASFRPVSVTLTFETQEELDAMGHIFNNNAISAGIGEAGAPDSVRDLWEVFQEAGARLDFEEQRFFNNAFHNYAKKQGRWN